jgi:DNA-binding Xre family transcriptional regulator
MVTEGIRGKSGRRQHLYIAEWMEHRSLSDQKLADRVGVDRVTVTRWRTQQHRLDPGKIAALAEALDCEPEDLWRLPTRPSIDAMLKNESDEMVKRAMEVITILRKTG